jgi:hypothetical protein
MTHSGSIDWTGLSGKKYTYWIYPITATFTAASGNYAFIKQIGSGAWSVVYFGETGDLSKRYDNHHNIDAAKAKGATHICVHWHDGDDAVRRAEESDLIDGYKPHCND